MFSKLQFLLAKFLRNEKNNRIEHNFIFQHIYMIKSCKLQEHVKNYKQVARRKNELLF